MTYTHNIDEASYSARTGEEIKEENEDLEFYLSNGQRDVYSYGDTIATADALKAFVHFFQNEMLITQIHWHKDF
jgi:pyruvate-formate lyase-activating enzyme